MLSTNAYYYGPCVKFVDTDNEKSDINITRLFLFDLFDEMDEYVVMMLLSNPRGVSLVLNLIKDDPQCRVDLLRNKRPNLSATPSPDAVTFLRNNLAAIDWGMLSRNTCPEAIELLEELPPEDNKITRLFDQKIAMDNAANSQGLIHCYKELCVAKKCLDCSIGIHLLKK